jgi:hypothetical protein
MTQIHVWQQDTERTRVGTPTETSRPPFAGAAAETHGKTSVKMISVTYSVFETATPGAFK